MSQQRTVALRRSFGESEGLTWGFVEWGWKARLGWDFQERWATGWGRGQYIENQTGFRDKKPPEAGRWDFRGGGLRGRGL